MFWATRGPYDNDSSQAFISIWVTVLSPQWPAPGTCHGGLWDYLSIKLWWPPAPHPFLWLTMQVLTNSLHPSPPSPTPCLHTKIISLFEVHRLPVSVCKLHVNHRSHILYSTSAWTDNYSVAELATGCSCGSLPRWSTTQTKDFSQLDINAEQV